MIAVQDEDANTTKEYYLFICGANLALGAFGSA